jgi:hypothetical protein
MNFAFYGRAVTTDRQQARTIHDQQVADAAALVASLGGRVVHDFFDTYPDRHRTWRRRRHATRLLTALADPRRSFAAIIVSDTRTALSPYQYHLVLSLCTNHGVQLWLSEIDGPFASNNTEHERIMMELFWEPQPVASHRLATGTTATTAIQAPAAPSIQGTHIRHEQRAYESDPQVQRGRRESGESPYHLAAAVDAANYQPDTKDKL